MVQISDGSVSHFFKGTHLPCNNVVAARLSSNKYFLRRLIIKEGLPAPRTISLRTPSAWRTVLQSSLSFPLVVKPITASHANGATLNITTPKDLEEAVIRAFAYIRKYKQGDRVLVEEYFTGDDLRLLVIGNEVVSVAKREPAYVIGNGTDTIRQLIQAFNTQWYSPVKYELPLCPIPFDREVRRYLQRHNRTLRSIPAMGEKVYLRWNANVSTGGRPSEIRNNVHPRLQHLAVQVAKIANLEIGGVDMMVRDITSGDTSSANVSILEINDSPGLDIHHFPYEGQGVDVASAILDHIFDTQDTYLNPTAISVESLLHDLYTDFPAPAIYQQDNT